MTSPTITLAQQLIQRESVTPADAGCQQLLAERLKRIGFDCQSLRFGDGEPVGPVDNLWAVRGSDGPLFCFAGHTDVVPVGSESEWKNPPFAAIIEGDMLTGRGAADMKGSIAAMIVAIEEFVESHDDHTGRIALLITSDEEGPALFGTKKVIEHLEKEQKKIDWCLVGEPSSTDKVGDVVKNGRRGSLTAHLSARGIQGHVAYPDKAHNPIHSLLPALTEMTNRQWDSGNDFFPPTSFQISNIQSGTGASNVIPGLITACFNLRFSTEWTSEKLKSEILSTLKKHQIDADIQWEVSEPFLTPEGPLLDAVKTAIRQQQAFETEAKTTGGTSDGRFIAPTGAEVVELGPVNATIHKVDECVAVEDLEQLKNIYKSTLEQLLLKPANHPS